MPDASSFLPSSIRPFMVHIALATKRFTNTQHLKETELSCAESSSVVSPSSSTVSTSMPRQLQCKSRDDVNPICFLKTHAYFAKTVMVRKGGEGKTKQVKCLTQTAEQSVKEAAVQQNDFELLGLICGEDLI